MSLHRGQNISRPDTDRLKSLYFLLLPHCPGGGDGSTCWSSKLSKELDSQKHPPTHTHTFIWSHWLLCFKYTIPLPHYRCKHFTVAVFYRCVYYVFLIDPFSFSLLFSVFVFVCLCVRKELLEVLQWGYRLCVCSPTSSLPCPEGEQWPVIGPLLLLCGPVWWLHLSRAANRLLAAGRALCRAAAWQYTLCRHHTGLWAVSQHCQTNMLYWYWPFIHK